MKKTISLLLSLVALLSSLTIVSVPASAEELYDVSVAVDYCQSEARTILPMINEMRTGEDAWYWNSDNKTKTLCKNLDKLVYDYSLESVAMQRAVEIALSFSHTRPDGTSCFSAIDEENINYYSLGENIAIGYSTAESVNYGWREDDCNYSGQGHRRNMLANDFNCVGIACASLNGLKCWVEEFAYIPEPDTTERQANNKSTSVSVRVSSDNISSVELNATSTIDVDISKDYKLAKPDCMLVLNDFWGWRYPTVSAEVTYDVKSNDVIEFNNGVIKPLKLGKASIVVTSLGVSKEILINVTCKHSYKVIESTEPGCNTDGYIHYECSKCKDTKTEVIPASHKYETIPAKLSKEGSVKCSVCGYVKSTIASPKTFTLSKASYTYDGKVKKPSVTVKDSEGKTISSDNYSVSYEKGRKSVGKYYVKITFKGNYSGSKTLYFTIKPKGTEISKLTAGSKSFTVNWKKQATQTSGYEIQYATDSKITKNVKASTASASTTSKRFKNLKSKKNYYVRIRTYKTVKVNGKSTKLYSGWSKVKAIKTK